MPVCVCVCVCVRVRACVYVCVLRTASRRKILHFKTTYYYNLTDHWMACPVLPPGGWCSQPFHLPGLPLRCLHPPLPRLLPHLLPRLLHHLLHHQPLPSLAMSLQSPHWTESSRCWPVLHSLEYLQIKQNQECWWNKHKMIFYIIIIMYISHALINALNAHMIHINLNMIFYTHVERSPTIFFLHKVLLKNKKQQTKMHYKHTKTHTHAHTHTHTLTVAETEY